jgi:hypothetical protein
MSGLPARTGALYVFARTPIFAPGNARRTARIAGVVQIRSPMLSRRMKRTLDGFILERRPET